jgi:hypothetical protein
MEILLNPGIALKSRKVEGYFNIQEARWFVEEMGNLVAQVIKENKTLLKDLYINDESLFQNDIIDLPSQSIKEEFRAENFKSAKLIKASFERIRDMLFREHSKETWDKYTILDRYVIYCDTSCDGNFHYKDVVQSSFNLRLDRLKSQYGVKHKFRMNNGVLSVDEGGVLRPLLEVYIDKQALYEAWKDYFLSLFSSPFSDYGITKLTNNLYNTIHTNLNDRKMTFLHRMNDKILVLTYNSFWNKRRYNFKTFKKLLNEYNLVKTNDEPEILMTRFKSIREQKDYINSIIDGIPKEMVNYVKKEKQKLELW